jgi:hypothetical protein
MSLGASLRAGQTAAEATHTLTLTAYSPTGLTAQNETSGLEVPTFTTETTGLAGKVQASSAQAGDTATRYVTVGGVDRPVLAAGLHISISAKVPAAGAPHVAGGAWEYLVTAVGTYDDPALLNRRYRVVQVPAKSFATARRLDVVEVS